jgi:PAS domain S-box-containing protein
LRTPETLCTLEEGHNLKVARRRSRNADFVGRIGGVIWGVRLQDLGIDQLLESVRDAVVVADARSGRIVLWNAAATKMFGYSSSEALVHSWTVIVPERLKAECEAGMARYRDTGHGPYIDSHTVLELPAVRKGGEEITIEIALSPIGPIRDSEGDDGRFVLAIVRDVTERKEVEKGIKASEERFRSLVQNTSDIITILQADGTVRYISPAIEKVLGYKPEEQIGINAFGAVHPDDRERALGIFAEVLNRPGLYPPLEFRVPHKDGSWRYIEHIVTNLLDDPVVRGVVVTSRDVTERKRAEEEARRLNESLEQRVAERTVRLQATFTKLEERERRFRQLFENSADALFVHDEQGGFVDCNAAACRALGYTREELLQLSVADVATHLISEEERREKKGNTLWERAMQGTPGRIVGFEENELQRKDGTIFPVEVGVGAIEYEGRQLIFASVRDTTERKRTEEELRRLNEELEGRVRRRTAQLEAFNSELEAFSYSVSHDLRAPLRAIDGFSQILLEDYKDKLDEEGKLYLTRIKNASQRMGHLIDDLLDLSRMTRGEMNRERVDLSDLAKKIVDELRRVQPERQVEAVIEQGLVANGDPRLLRVVLENLLGNAWKFTRDQPHPRIEFGLLEYESAPAYFVRDNGVGFDMAYADKLFGAFQRLHTISEFEGTGIGLATVQRIIHRHDGRVWAKGQVGKGSTFFFTLQRTAPRL